MPLPKSIVSTPLNKTICDIDIASSPVDGGNTTNDDETSEFLEMAMLHKVKPSDYPVNSFWSPKAPSPTSVMGNSALSFNNGYRDFTLDNTPLTPTPYNKKPSFNNSSHVYDMDDAMQKGTDTPTDLDTKLLGENGVR